LEDDFARFARYARDAARTEEPAGGTCPVVLTGDALHILFAYLAHHSSARAKYQGSALFSPGEPILQDTPEGDTVTLYSNALHHGGTHSYRFDTDGLPGRRVKVIDDGVLTRYWSTKQYADYLDIEPTGLWSNFEIAPGNTSWDDLFKSDDRVILVVQFSSFDPQPVAGNYLGEIRVGYEYRRDGSVVPLRGGSVSGNLAESLVNCRFCREVETFEGYYGPKGVRFEQARIAGK
jgi:PmbA protein